MALFDQSDKNSLSPEIRRELDRLLERLCDDLASDAEYHRLSELLSSNPAARRYYLKSIAVHSALITTAGSQVRGAISLESFASVSPEQEEPPNAATKPASPAKWAALLLAVAAAVAILATAIDWRKQEPGQPTIAGQLPTRHLDAQFSEDRASVAEVTYVSNTTRWKTPNSSFVLASRVRSTEHLQIEAGEVELTYPSGTRLLLTGPSEYVVHPTGGVLLRGELVAKVTESGHGFTIETPNGKVVDLGTEFGVVVDDFGVSQVSVYKGKVETHPAGDFRDKIELTSGRAIQWSGNAIIPVEAERRRYQLPGLAPPTHGGIIQAGLEEEFQGEPLDSAIWSTHGNVTSTPRGLLLTSLPGIAQRPLLVTTQEFDPAKGPVTVVCDLRFKDLHAAESVSFAILTRSTNTLSKAGTAWQDMLARGLRCRLNGDPVSGEGKLECGVKHEADRDFANLTWGGFTQLKSDDLYRIELRDDGLNATFTVSLVSNPEVRKTITCRSLFRGDHNFVAFEGCAVGTTLIERVSIWQRESGASDAGLVNSVRPSANVGAAAEVPLQQLAPKSARLVVSDDFSSATLNSELWTVLGESVLLDGQLQLGLPNAQHRIDTWRKRPYLLTKQTFNPQATPLTILGRVTFAANFLQGYGSSFAVMTRASGAHGGGPTWERSLLSRGVRGNFWPAAFGFDHSLEIHEKPQPETTTLLASAPLAIYPNSRTYMFRVVDDGRSMKITLVDAASSAIRKTLTASLNSTPLTEGHIGLEGCWGSPVLLDDIHIYQSASSQDQAER